MTSAIVWLWFVIAQRINLEKSSVCLSNRMFFLLLLKKKTFLVQPKHLTKPGTLY